VTVAACRATGDIAVEVGGRDGVAVGGMKGLG